jgi:hypothetical protein
MEELSKHRGCAGLVVAFVVLAITGGIGAFLQQDGEPPAALMLGGFLAAIALGVGIWKDARWARIPTGAILSLVGASLAIFILVDFAKYLTGGQSAMSGSGGGAYGQAVFIVFMTGIALLGSGLYLLGVLKSPSRGS